MNKRIVQYLLAGMLFVGVIVFTLMFTIDNPRYDLILSNYPMLIDGIVSTLIISVVSLFLSMIAGFLLFLIMNAKNHFTRAIGVIFSEIIMGTPLIVMVFLVVYVIGEVFSISSKFNLGILSLTLYMAPYMANSYKTAISVIGREQYIVMDLYHFKGYQKYLYIIFPQMIRPLIPSLINNLSSIIKGSALLKIVSVMEISYVLTVISSRNWAAIEGYYVMWIIYLCITIPLSILAKYIGKKVSQ